MLQSLRQSRIAWGGRAYIESGSRKEPCLPAFEIVRDSQVARALQKTTIETCSDRNPEERLFFGSPSSNFCHVRFRRAELPP